MADELRAVREEGGRDTIFARATAAGEGAIAVIRISGERSLAVLESVFRHRSGKPHRVWKSHQLVAGRIVESRTGHTLDEVMAVYMERGRSFTGEPVAEIHCHGGDGVTQGIEEALLALGARAAKPGEFTRRAFLDGRLTLDAAEAIDDIVRSRSQEVALVSAANLIGSVRRRIHAMREALVSLLALLEANVDFPEDDVDEATRARVLAEVTALERETAQLAASYERGRLIREGIRVVLAGAPNVGKSSLMNALLRSERCIVTPTPGTTRDTIEESLSFRGRRYLLVDTAGLRRTEDAIEREGVTRALQEVEKADLVLLVLDGSRAIEPDEAARAIGPEADKAQKILVSNKLDLCGEDWQKNTGLTDGGAIAVSARTGEGIEKLVEAIHERARKRIGDEDSGPIVSNSRHRDCLLRANTSLTGFRHGIAAGTPIDVGLVDLHEASCQLAGITGEIVSEEILDAIFSRFCIGK